MRIFVSLMLAGLLVSACATQRTPKDVEAFVARRDLCDHFRGEIPDPEEAEQMRETLRQLDKYCTGTDAALAALKERYRDDPKIMEKLEGYESRIEKTRR